MQILHIRYTQREVRHTTNGKNQTKENKIDKNEKKTEKNNNTQANGVVCTLHPVHKALTCSISSSCASAEYHITIKNEQNRDEQPGRGREQEKISSYIRNDSVAFGM